MGGDALKKNPPKIKPQPKHRSKLDLCTLTKCEALPAKNPY